MLKSLGHFLRMCEGSLQLKQPNKIEIFRRGTGLKGVLWARPHRSWLARFTMIVFLSAFLKTFRDFSRRATSWASLYDCSTALSMLCRGWKITLCVAPVIRVDETSSFLLWNFEESPSNARHIDVILKAGLTFWEFDCILWKVWQKFENPDAQMLKLEDYSGSSWL